MDSVAVEGGLQSDKCLSHFITLELSPETCTCTEKGGTESARDTLQLGKLPLGDENINYVLHLLLISSSSVCTDIALMCDAIGLSAREEGRRRR